MAFMGCVGSHTHDARLQAIEEAVKVTLVHTVQLQFQLRFRSYIVGRLKVLIGRIRM